MGTFQLFRTFWGESLGWHSFITQYSGDFASRSWDCVELHAQELEPMCGQRDTSSLIALVTVETELRYPFSAHT